MKLKKYNSPNKQDIVIKKIFHIRRQASPTDEPYWQDFSYQTKDDGATVATALAEIAGRSADDFVETQKQTEDGRADGKDGVTGARCVTADIGRTAMGTEKNVRPLAWEHSCLQRKCGACAMVIDDIPRLACDVRLSSLKKETVTVEPLRKFPVVEDLIVDRSTMMARLKELSVWYDGEAKVSGEQMAFEASKCLQCGLCLEICPNFTIDGTFFGMAAMAPMARVIAKLPDGQRKKLSENYQKAVYEGCGKSLACRDVCPAGIDMDGLLARSNGAAVWRRWKIQ